MMTKGMCVLMAQMRGFMYLTTVRLPGSNIWESVIDHFIIPTASFSGYAFDTWQQTFTLL